MTTNTRIKVRLFSYNSFRHYGGREIATTPYICLATFIQYQSDHTMIVELLEDCAGYKKGHKIAVLEQNFNIS